MIEHFASGYITGMKGIYSMYEATVTSFTASVTCWTLPGTITVDKMVADAVESLHRTYGMLRRVSTR